MIVVDANVIIYHVVKGPMSASAEALAKIDGDWRSPSLWRFEFTNALRNMLRAKLLDEPRALSLIADARLAMDGREMDVPQETALAAAQRYDISAYDAQYVALAEISNTLCVTADAPLAKKVPRAVALLTEYLKSNPTP